MFGKKGKKDSKDKDGITDSQRRVYKFWLNNINRAKKAQPKGYWREARERYSAKESLGIGGRKANDERPFVNDLRKQHESSMAFLDQQEPSFKVSPAEGFIADERAQKQAECEAKYLKYVWKEQKCQKVQSRKLNNAVLINNGDSLVQFDVKKWMPSLRFLQAENVLFDTDCDGIIEEANWRGYWEDVAPEEFKSWHPDMPDKTYKEILKQQGSVLSEAQQEAVDENDRDMFKAVRVYHIFARNAYAIREETDEGEPEEINKRLAEELQLDTPRRYIQLVEGYTTPVTDDKTWPFDLDHEEFPISHLQFNQTNNDLYGFTDYQQMSRLDEESDDVIKNIAIAAFWASVKKFGTSSNLKIEDLEIDDFLNKPKTTFLRDIVDSVTGKSKIVPLERGYIDIALMEAYKLIHDQAKEASAMSELLENADAQAYKDVTALAARIVDANMHQRINRRLGGPWGYEPSIAEDAIKMLEIAHQFVPQYSQVAIMRDFPVLDELQQPVLDGLGQPVMEQKEDLVDLPWNEALKAIAEGGQLIKLGVDTIVGQTTITEDVPVLDESGQPAIDPTTNQPMTEQKQVPVSLAEFWPYKQPPQQWRLSTKVIVEPGTTRSITKEQQTAVLKQLYVEMFQPFYERIGRLDLARDYLEMIGRLADVPAIDSKLPEPSEIKQQMEMEQQMKQMQAQMQLQQGATQTATGEAGGQPLNSPEATGGEIQETEGMV